jgi:hypothetical protein
MRSKPNLLLAALGAVVVFQFALNSGVSETAIWFAAAILILLCYHGDRVPCTWPRSILGLGALILAALVVSWTASYDMADTTRSERLLKFFALTAATYIAGRTVRPNILLTTAASIIATIVIWQFAVRHLGSSPYGEFKNPHYLAYFILLLLPAFLLIAARLPRPFNYMYALLLLPALELTFNDYTKPALPLLAASGAISITIFVAAIAWRRWSAVLLAGTGIVMASAIAPVAVQFFMNDERIIIWGDALRMVSVGPTSKWFTGHGLGSFRDSFALFATEEFAWLTLPHNFFIEILYELGFPILVTITAAYTCLVASAIRLAHLRWHPGARNSARANLATLVIWSLFSFFAFSAFSAYTLYPLAFIIGSHVALQERYRTRVSSFD